MQRKRIIFVIAAAILLTAILAYVLTHRSSPLIYSGTIETREINIGSKIGGRVTNVFVEEGQQVPANAPLVTFDAPELQAQLAQAHATVVQTDADYNRLQHGNRPQEIAQADATLHESKALYDEALNGPRPEDIRHPQAEFAAAQANATDAASTYDRMKPLAAQDIISKQQFDAYTAQRDNTAQIARSAQERRGVSAIIPATYYIQVIRGIVLRGAGFSDLWLNALILTLMGSAAILTAAYAFMNKTPSSLAVYAIKR